MKFTQLDLLNMVSVFSISKLQILQELTKSSAFSLKWINISKTLKYISGSFFRAFIIPGQPGSFYGGYTGVAENIQTNALINGC